VIGQATRAAIALVREERAPGQPIEEAATAVWFGTDLGSLPEAELANLRDRGWRAAGRYDNLRTAIWEMLGRALAQRGPDRDDAIDGVGRIVAYWGFLELTAAELGAAN